MLGTGYIPMPENDDKILDFTCALLCGYDDTVQYFTFQSDFGTLGINGFFFIPYAYILDPEKCGCFVVSIW